MTLINRFAAVLNIRPGEGRLVNLLLLHSFFVGVNRVFLLSVATSLFLTEFGANTLPFVYIAIAVVNSSVGFLYARLGERISFVKLLIANLAFQLVLVLGFWLLFGLTNAQWPAILFMISMELLWLLTGLEFWSLSARVFNLQQGKRLFGVVGAGDTVASIIGGFAIPFLVAPLGTHNLLLLSVASILISLSIILMIARQFGERLMAEEPSESRRESAVRYANPLKNRYIVLIFAFAFMATVTFYFVENTFYGLAEVQYPESDTLTSFLGVYFGLLSLVQLGMQSFVTGRIINRLGVTVCIIIVPLLVTTMIGITTLVGLAASVVFLTFIFMAGTRLVEYVTGTTITYSCQLTMYQSLPSIIRVQTQTQVESLIEPLTTGVTGILLLVILAIPGWGTIQLLLISVLIGLVWTAVGVLLSREYPKALVQALTKRRLGHMQYVLKEQAVSALVRTRLAESNAGEVLYLLNLLQEAEPDALAKMLPDLIKHPAAEVRVDVLHRIAALGLVAASPAVEKILSNETDVAVRAAAIQAAIVLDPDAMLKQIKEYLSADEPPIQLASIVALMQSGNIEATLLAQDRLAQLYNSNNSSDRAYAAQALGEIGLQDFYQPLAKLLHDDDLTVRRAAIVAAGQLKNPHLWRPVIENLSVKAVRSVAISALTNAGESVQLTFAEILAEIRREIESGSAVRRTLVQQIARICGRLRITAVLERHIDFPDVLVREQVLTALAQSQYRTPDVARIESQIWGEILGDLLYLQGLALLKEDPLLRGALRYMLNQTRQRVFLLCSFIYDAQTILRARDDYYSASESQRSYALEVLHVTLARDLRLPIIALLDDDIESRQGLDALMEICEKPWLTRQRWFDHLLTSGDVSPWLKVSALYGIRRRIERQMIRAVEQAESDDSSIVRETAQGVLDRLDDHTIRRR
jgi:HEAT repeat protein/ATP/ADP translocase